MMLIFYMVAWRRKYKTQQMKHFHVEGLLGTVKSGPAVKSTDCLAKNWHRFLYWALHNCLEFQIQCIGCLLNFSGTSCTQCIYK